MLVSAAAQHMQQLLECGPAHSGQEAPAVVQQWVPVDAEEEALLTLVRNSPSGRITFQLSYWMRSKGCRQQQNSMWFGLCCPYLERGLALTNTSLIHIRLLQA